MKHSHFKSFIFISTLAIVVVSTTINLSLKKRPKPQQPPTKRPAKDKAPEKQPPRLATLKTAL